MKKTKLILVLVLALVSFLPLSSVQADIAPPKAPPGFNPKPGDEFTQVRMVEETVVISVMVTDPAQAHVAANFTMRNLGDETEFMMVRFPLSFSDFQSGYSEILNFSVKVNQQPVEHERYYDEEEKEESLIPIWARFPAAFPVDQDVQIRVSYDLPASPLTETDFPFFVRDDFISFGYILQTGAGWKGTIGKAEIVVILPYEVNELNLISFDDWFFDESFTYEKSGQEIRAVYTDFEPTYSHNISVYLVNPMIWKQVLIEKQNIDVNENDGEAWGRLAKAYKASLIYRGKEYCRRDGNAAAELYELSMNAYEKATTLLPNDALWHAGYADLLVHSGNMGCSGTQQDFDRALTEMQKALELAPMNETVLEIAGFVSDYFPGRMNLNKDGSYDFIIMTSTPRPTPTLESTNTVETIEKSQPLVMQTEEPPARSDDVTPTPDFENIPAPVPTPKKSSPICGSVALPVGVITFIFITRKKKKNY